MSKIHVITKEKRFPTAPDLYGLFFEDISRAGDGGLYPEMLRNRSFEDSILPKDCVTSDGGKTFVSPTGWIDEFNNGEGMHDWVRRNQPAPTQIPAWYAENAQMNLDSDHTLNEKREVSLLVNFKQDGLIYNTGYCGVPAKEGESALFYAFIESQQPVDLEVSIRAKDEILCRGELHVIPGGFQRYDLKLTPSKTCSSACLAIRAKSESTVRFGFTSLMPEKTFLGHGLRVDLCEKLRDMHPAFLRFPGGCIVEGFTKETAMYFKNVVGPVWERPSHWLLWHYRTTNGLGFHEYLQLCEDLGMKAFYVCNVGMTCQGRGPYYFNDEETLDMLEDVLAALEYALGPADSKWGSLRAKMGHKDPFVLSYLEIGNENSGPEYEKRYLLFREKILSKYPDLKIIANDRGRGVTLPADIADDHYYNMPEFFAENVGLYDSYDRSQPDVFVGEFAVNQTYEGQLRAAVSEAMFMVGFERNQDAVKLCAYAPLFENVNFYSWFPNLLIFDNMRSYTIPTYYAFKLFSEARGEFVVTHEEQSEKIYRALHGLPMISGDFGIRFRNASFNGKPVVPSHDLLGKSVLNNGEYSIIEDTSTEFSGRRIPARAFAALGEEISAHDGIFETDLFIEKGKEAGCGVLCAPKPLSFYDRMNPNPRGEWMLFNIEPIRLVLSDGKAQIVRGTLRVKPLTEKVDLILPENEFVHVCCEVKDDHLYCSVDGKDILSCELPNYPSMVSVATDSKDELFVKVVNFAEKEDQVEISLDCNVEDAYQVTRLTGAADAENSLENPDCVKDETILCKGASREFIFSAPPLSINVLRLKKNN